MSIILRDIWKNNNYTGFGEGCFWHEIKGRIEKYGYISATSDYSVHDDDFLEGVQGTYVQSFGRIRSHNSLYEEKNCKDFNEKRIHRYFELYGY